MEILTHQHIDQTLCGQPLEVSEGGSRVQLKTIAAIAADNSGLVHGGFIFSLADYAAMIAVNTGRAEAALAGQLRNVLDAWPSPGDMARLTTTPATGLRILRRSTAATARSSSSSARRFSSSAR